MITPRIHETTDRLPQSSLGLQKSQQYRVPVGFPLINRLSKLTILYVPYDDGLLADDVRSSLTYGDGIRVYVDDRSYLVDKYISLLVPPHRFRIRLAGYI